MADPKECPDEAERRLREAEDSSDPNVQRAMLEIAGLYDRMADTLAKRGSRPKKS
jgi:hypothetical protein